MSQDINNCIFCLDNEGRLLRNNKCPCNYVFHSNCYESYNRKNMCPMCRASVPTEYEIIEVKQSPPSRPILPSRPTESTTNYTQLDSGPQINQRLNMQLNVRHLLCALLAVFIGIIIIINIIIALY